MTPKEMLEYEKIETLQIATISHHSKPTLNWTKQQLIDYIAENFCPEDFGYKVAISWQDCANKKCSECWNNPFENKEFEAKYYKTLMEEKKQAFCPYCASKLKVIYTIGQEDNDVSIIVGRCNHCHKAYEWKYDRRTYKKFDFKNNI